MNVDHILETLNQHNVRYLLIGGMNFLLRHAPVLTYDIDIWIEDSADNREQCHVALVALEASWGATDDDWGPLADKDSSWLDTQLVFCLTSPHGAIDIFRGVTGLDNWHASANSGLTEKTSLGIEYCGISDADMLRCQQALDASQRNHQRVAALEKAIADQTKNRGDVGQSEV